MDNIFRERNKKKIKPGRKSCPGCDALGILTEKRRRIASHDALLNADIFAFTSTSITESNLPSAIHKQLADGNLESASCARNLSPALNPAPLRLDTRSPRPPKVRQARSSTFFTSNVPSLRTSEFDERMRDGAILAM